MAWFAARPFPFWLGLVLLVLVAYLPVWHAGFIWDDDAHVTRPELRSLAGLFRIWTEPGATQQYYPVLHSAFWIEHQLWGDAPAGYHWLNLFLHATVAALFGRLLLRLAVPGWWLAAGIFALHPVGVESVAWISEQKNTLSAVWALAAALVYLRFDARPRTAAYLLATALFAAALLTKTVTAVLPAALWVILWWRDGRVDLRAQVRPLLPWLALSVLAGSATAWVERELIGAKGIDFSLGVVERVLLAGRVPFFYLGKLIWPANLIFIYPKGSIQASDVMSYVYPLALLALLARWFVLRSWSRAPLAVALLFIGTLVPVLGFFNVYPFLFSYVADHFQYLACLAPLALIGAGLGRWLEGRSGLLAALVACGLAGGLGVLTWRQARNYRDVTTLYQRTLAQNPFCWLAANNLGNVHADAGRSKEAISLFQRALTLRPDYPEAENNLGEQFNRTGPTAEAIVHLRRAVALKPDYAEAHNNLGHALAQAGDAAGALTEFHRAITFYPGYAEAHYNLGLVLASTGRPADAALYLERAAQLRPDFAAAWLNLGVARLQLDRPAEAATALETAIARQPTLPEARFNYARALVRLKREAEALTQLDEAVRLNPDYGAAFALLAQLHLQRNEMAPAATALESLVRLDPGNTNFRDLLAKVRQSLGRP